MSEIPNVAVVTLLYTPPFDKFVNPTPASSCHWYVKLVPVAVTVKLVEVPSHCVTSDGSKVTTGSVFTVNVPAVEVTEGVHVPETTTR